MHFKMSSAICYNLDQSKILSSGNGLKKTEERNDTVGVCKVSANVTLPTEKMRKVNSLTKHAYH